MLRLTERKKPTLYTIILVILSVIILFVMLLSTNILITKILITNCPRWLSYLIVMPVAHVAIVSVKLIWKHLHTKQFP